MTAGTLDIDLPRSIAASDAEDLANLAAVLFDFQRYTPVDSELRTWVDANLDLVLAVQDARAEEEGG